MIRSESPVPRDLPPFAHKEEANQRFKEFWDGKKNDPNYNMRDVPKLQEDFERWFQDYVKELIARTPPSQTRETPVYHRGLLRESTPRRPEIPPREGEDEDVEDEDVNLDDYLEEDELGADLDEETEPFYAWEPY